MVFDLALPKPLRGEGWKVKIRERERVEPPHVTILWKMRSWRVGLRDESFLIPPGGSWNDIDRGVRDEIRKNWKRLIEEWDKKYPENPVSSNEDE